MVGTRQVLAACLVGMSLVTVAAARPAAGAAGSANVDAARPAAVSARSVESVGYRAAYADASESAAPESPGESPSGSELASPGPASPLPSDTASTSPVPSDEPPASPSPTPLSLMPLLRGTVLDLDGHPLDMSGGNLELDETQDGDGSPSWHTLVPVGADGTFAVRVMPWGTPTAPARLTLSFGPSDYVAPIVTHENGATCYRWTGLTGMLRLDVVLSDGSEAPDAVVRASRTVEEAICGAQGTPTPEPSPAAPATRAPGASAGPHQTPPATTAEDGETEPPMAGLVVALAVLLLTAAVLAVRETRRTRRR